MYWITANVFSLSQLLFFKIPYVRKALKIPTMKVRPQPPAEVRVHMHGRSCTSSRCLDLCMCMCECEGGLHITWFSHLVLWLTASPLHMLTGVCLQMRQASSQRRIQFAFPVAKFREGYSLAVPWRTLNEGCNLLFLSAAGDANDVHGLVQHGHGRQ